MRCVHHTLAVDGTVVWELNLDAVFTLDKLASLERHCRQR